MKVVLPAIRADFEVIASYEYTEEAPLAWPFTVFGGIADVLVSEDSLRAWQAHTTAPIILERFPGGHFYLAGWSSRIVATICTQADITLRSLHVAASR
jgi:medium-chain acyl-[acyl-carrier-protein] hydrolase